MVWNKHHVNGILNSLRLLYSSDFNNQRLITLSLPRAPTVLSWHSSYTLTTLSLLVRHYLLSQISSISSIHSSNWKIWATSNISLDWKSCLRLMVSSCLNDISPYSCWKKPGILLVNLLLHQWISIHDSLYLTVNLYQRYLPHLIAAWLESSST